MKQPPIGIQTFEKIIKDDYLYVDKTKQIYDIITTGTTYFISRPRRFGKSLLCSTLEQIFKGNKELFKNLWIYDSDYQWESHPVIRIDMSKIRLNNTEDFEKKLFNQMREIAKDNNIDYTDYNSPEELLSAIIKNMSKKNKVVIIVDEYDKPILDHITNTQIAEKVRNILKSFYGQFKTLDEYLKFIFLTGVTRFSKMSVFSGLNNLRDLTFNEKAATLFGYTQKELEFYFEERIKICVTKQKTSKKQILLQLKDWYNGYSFVDGKQKVYNPFSILLSLDDYKFKNYWFETGTPTFLVNMIREKNFDYTDPKSFEATELQLGNFDINNINLKTLLFQTGYLTIDSYDQSLRKYHLKYPNNEVEESLLEVLLESFSGIDAVISDDTIIEITNALMKNDLNQFREIIYNFFASMPYTIQINHEKYYQSIFYTLLRLLNIRIKVEVATNTGRIDSVVQIKDFIYIFEFKIDKSSTEALQQIEDKKYYQKFMSSKYKDKKIIIVGVNFDTKQKNISDFSFKTIKK
ncbi:MAG: AAA family ATPase [bacterium]